MLAHLHQATEHDMYTEAITAQFPYRSRDRTKLGEGVPVCVSYVCIECGEGIVHD